MKLDLSSRNQRSSSSRKGWSQGLAPDGSGGDSVPCPSLSCPSLPLIPLGEAPGWWSLHPGEAEGFLPGGGILAEQSPVQFSCLCQTRIQ